jgi:hypothetical protein
MKAVNARLSWPGITVTRQTSPITFALIVRIPIEGIEDFRAHEDAVLPLLPEFNGRLERRLRNRDGTVEVHVISFASEADFQNYRNDPRRAAQAWLLEKSSAMSELLPMANVP